MSLTGPRAPEGGAAQLDGPDATGGLRERLGWVRLGSEAEVRDLLTSHPAWEALAPIRQSATDARGAIADQGFEVDPGALGLTPILAEARERWGLALDLRLLMVPRPEYNAFVLANPFDGEVVLGASCSLVEDFEPRELAFVIGHELGHHALGHTAIAGRRRQLADHVAPHHPLRLLDASLGRRQEISADRAGLVVCGSAAAARTALLKAATQTPNRRLAAAVLAGGPDWAFVDPELDGVAPWAQSHPPARVRVRALEGFARDADGRSLADLDARCDGWLDALEADALKRDRATVERFAAAVGAVVGATAGVAEIPALFAAHAGPWLGQAGDLEDACATLRELASPGRRLRVLAAAISVLSADLRLGAEAGARTRALATRLGLPPEAADRRLAAARESLTLRGTE